MSGGHYGYNQYILDDIARTVRHDMSDYKAAHRTMTPIQEDVLRSMKETYNLLMTCAVRVQRLDWYMSDDDGEETYLQRQDEELNETVYMEV